ncbi:hypothetical protein [Dactylosporangium cerinum]
MAPPGLIDVHAHFVTDEYVAAARAAGIAHPDGMPGWPGWDPADHLELMRRGGIDKAYLSVSSPGCTSATTPPRGCSPVPSTSSAPPWR